MNRLALLSAPLISGLYCFANPAVAADFGGPAYVDEDVVIEHSAPVLEREHVIERRYYEPEEETYVTRRTYRYAPEIYAYTEVNGCGWLRRKAVFTRSPYWWHRYHECID